jgi:hypothetical protein
MTHNAHTLIHFSKSRILTLHFNPKKHSSWETMIHNTFQIIHISESQILTLKTSTIYVNYYPMHLPNILHECKRYLTDGQTEGLTAGVFLQVKPAVSYRQTD